MIYWLYMLLRTRSKIARIGLGTFPLFLFIIGGCIYFGRITLQLGIGLGVGLILIWSGLFNKPYLYLCNTIRIKINKKCFKKRIYIYEYGRKICFSKKPNFYSSPIGIVMDCVVCIDEGEHDNPFLKILRKNYSISLYPLFKDFIEELDETDSLETIKKKLILHNL